MNFYLQGFLTFLKIGLFTIGGGYAMIPLIEREVVERRQWLKREEFLDLMSLSQALPGVFAVNFSIYIGHRLRGLRGSLALAAGVVLPSFVIILLVAMFFSAFADNRVVEAIFRGVRPAVVALIAVPCIKLGKSAHITWANAWFPIAVALLIALLGISPVYIIIAVALGAFVYGKFLQ
ncbi:MAG: chromate transporter [Bacteroidaceae bacterium]|jgi:chromate transporter|nr:chromate transporter [Bacteroidaceae bacterium]MBR4649654.1 chromate transporter [Bacteroidaceae bacterium]